MHDRPVYCGNFDYETTPKEVEKLFEKYGDVDRVEMKTGFAFVYMKDQKDAEDAVQSLDRIEWGHRRRRLRVEFARGDGHIRRREELRRRGAEPKPSSCLFVVNFDQHRCTERDLERHFRPYGHLQRVQIRRNFAFIQYETVEEATEALKNTHLSKLQGRVISCEYVVNTEGRAGGRGSSRERSRSRSRSPYERGKARLRSLSPSPVRRRSPGKENGRYLSRSPVSRRGGYSRSRSRSPYGRSRSRSLSPSRRRSRSP